MTCHRILVVLLLVLLLPVRSDAVPMVVNYVDSPGEGFNDPVLGSARRTAFEYAISLWSAQLDGSVTVVVQAEMNPLGGSATSAVLAQAGPRSIWKDFFGAPLADTWYVDAEANQLAGFDLNSLYDISVVANSDVDNETVLGSVNWYYGLDENPGIHVDFVTTILHELGHGLGFLSFIDETTGQWLFGTPDIYARQLTQPGVGDLTVMSDAQRKSSLTSDNLFWKGPQVVAAKSGNVKMYAPSTFEVGSSLSHWDPSNTPDLLMEPFDTGPSHSIDLTREAFLDMGWTFLPEALPTPSITPTSSPTSTPTSTGTATSTSTTTGTATSTSTATPTPSNTEEPSSTPTSTSTPSESPSPTNTETKTPTQQPSSTPSQPPTETVTSTPPPPTATETETPSLTITSTLTSTEEPTPSMTLTETMTPSLESTPTATPTDTLTETSLPTENLSSTPTLTETTIPDATHTFTPDYDVAPVVKDGKINALDLLEVIQSNPDAARVLFDFSRFWGTTVP